jgi:ketosteroid isomerase-like protein
MSAELTSPNPVELVRRSLEAANRRDVDAILSFFAPDAVWETLLDGPVEGKEAIRGAFADWLRSYETYEVELEETLHVGGGVVLALTRHQGRLAGGGDIRQAFPCVYVWEDGVITRFLTIWDGRSIDEARAAAERLAGERE